MSWLSRIRHLDRRLRDHGTTEAELDEEVQGYFETMIERRMSRGLSLEEAQREARLDFGGKDEASLALNRLLQSQLYSVSSSDPAIYGLTSVVLIAVALCACLIPARRATRVDPIVALRNE